MIARSDSKEGAGKYGRFPFRKKTPQISVGAEVEFPIGT